jgi:uncharacterized protein DUF4124
MKTAVLVSILVIFAFPASAVTYKWVDDQGTVNFTEDLGSVPPKYRKKARVVGAEEDATPPPTSETKEEAKPVQKPKGAGQTSEQPLTEKKELKKTYGEKSAEAWKAEFGQLSAEIKAAEDQLVELRGRLSDVSKMSRGEYLSIQKTINNSENRILGLRKKRDALNEEANKAEVPAEIRGQ